MTQEFVSFKGLKPDEEKRLPTPAVAVQVGYDGTDYYVSKVYPDGASLSTSNPFVDIDEICTISPDGKTIQTVSTGLGKTKTEIITLTSDGGYILATVIS